MYNKIESDEQINNLVKMAKIIWSDYFQKYFDTETLLEILENFQSKNVILEQIKCGHKYFFIEDNNKKIGYFAYIIDTDNSLLFLSKIYLYSTQRRNGTGKKVLDYLETICIQSNLKKLSLTVFHKNVIAISAYKKWGFVEIGHIDRILNNELILNDCKMEKYL